MGHPQLSSKKFTPQRWPSPTEWKTNAVLKVNTAAGGNCFAAARHGNAAHRFWQTVWQNARRNNSQIAPREEVELTMPANTRSGAGIIDFSWLQKRTQWAPRLKKVW